MKKTWHVLLGCFLLVNASFDLVASQPGVAISAPFTLDVKEPVVSLITPLGGGYLDYANPVMVSWGVSDDNLPQHAVNVELVLFPEQETHTLLSGADATGSNMLNLPQLQSAYAMIRVAATDMFGNIGSAQTAGYITLGTGATSVPVTPELHTSDFLIYPNPAHDRVMVKIQGQAQGNVEIYLMDIHGRQLDGRSILLSAESSLGFDISHLSPGVYFIAMDKAGKLVSSKFIIR